MAPETHNGIHIKTAYVPFYAFVAPVYDFESLEDLQVVDRPDDLWMVYKYSLITRKFSPFKCYECEVEASIAACKLHAKIAGIMERDKGMILDKETKLRVKQVQDRAADSIEPDEEDYYPWEEGYYTWEED